MTARSERSEASGWIARARRDLEKATVVHGIGAFDSGDVCAYAQQAAEKALKAVLAARDQPVPRMHDLLELRYRSAIEIAPQVTDEMLATVSAQWTSSRYPGDWAEPTESDALLALRVADSVVTAAARIIKELEQRS